MAVFSKNSLSQVSGIGGANNVLCKELVFGQKAFWNFELKNEGVPTSLVGATLNAQVLRREISNIADGRNGMTFDLADYSPTPTAISIPITNRDDIFGRFTLVLDDALWGLIGSDPDLDISDASPAAYSGRLKIGFPAINPNPAQDSIVFLLFLIRSDGVVN